MSSIQFTQTAYGLSQALINVFPIPIVSPAANPTTSNLAQIGTVWINKSTNTAFILTSIVSNSANWVSFTGGAGLFSSLTVNPGPTNLSTVGNGAVNIGNITNTGAITLNAGPGGLAIDGNGNTIDIANDANANTVVIGSTTAGAGVTILGGSSAGVTLSTSAAIGATITLGSAAMTGPIAVGVSTAGQAVNIANAVNTGTQTISIASGNGSANSVVNILNGTMTGGNPTFSMMSAGGQSGFVNIANGAAANSVVIGSTTGAAITTIRGGTGGITLNAPFTALPGPVYIYTGAGAPGAGLALHVGDLYINTTAASLTTRMYIATAASTWTNIVCAA